MSRGNLARLRPAGRARRPRRRRYTPTREALPLRTAERGGHPSRDSWRGTSRAASFGVDDVVVGRLVQEERPVVGSLDRHERARRLLEVERGVWGVGALVTGRQGG